MAQVEVRIFRQGREIARVTRPLRHLDGKPVVKYRKEFRPLVNGSEVWLDGIAPAACGPAAKTTDMNDSEVAPEFHVVPPALIEWDESQRRVIDARPGDRLLVGAGPGTGKTAVACARVSQLIDQGGLEPSRIWLISFTRTAVREIRDRIAAYLEDASAAYAVKIATLDSHAWTIHSGFDEEAKIFGSYEENIERVRDLVRQDDNVSDYLETVEHLVVDEAQDIVGIRADLVVEFIRKLSQECGVTVFADEAQAIYGFADDRQVREGQAGEPPLPEKIRRGAAGMFRECELTQVHRTGSPQLLTIFSDTRRKVLTAAGENGDKLAEIKDEVIRLAHGKAPNVDDAALAELEDAFILYRRRCDVLITTSMLTQNGIPHRVRMSGLPVCLVPWIGAALSEHTDTDLSRDRFMALWADKVHGTSLATFGADDAWANLVRIAGRTQTVVEMRLLRQRLGRKQPPAELCNAELGLHGPIVGTIHASKGREADTVHLMLPYASSENIDQDEEARVVYVGATRGRSRLLIGRGYRQFAGRVEASGRAYCLHTRNDQPRAQVEIGHDGDIGAEGLAGRRFFANPAAVRIAQSRIRSFADETVSLVAESDRDTDFVYRLKEDGQGDCLAVLSQAVNYDLFTVADAVRRSLGGGKRRPPDTIRHLHVRGVRTIVLPPEAPEGETLHEPWRNSGIMLAPLVLGYSTAYFGRRRR
ncbi:UvrD-helicase domain-containing protein [Consotaella aegiceratis]|uniref:UvrD-helicase domain-containing protein n=1 Tax=Consotaella aegiceratis TaxID=3097961 RepID=UPI002F3FF3CB